MASSTTVTTDGNTPQPSKSKYRPEIDGLRAFAVVAVIINHFNKDLLPSGYLGVDIFFVISGYVITSSLAGRQSKNFLDFLTGFYERRIKRLVPALVVFVLITSVLISLFNPDPGVSLGLGWRSLFGISNINLYQGSTDYFAQSTELNPFTHTWSLGVEEQFYLLFPFLIWFSGFGQQRAKGARNLFFWVGALTIASLIGFIYLYQVNQPAAYFLMPPRFWEMAAGCLIFIGFQKRARIEQALEQVPPLLVVAAMFGLMFLPISAAVPATIAIVVLSAILIACLKQGTAAYKFFTLEKVVFVGLISYSLYLWHWTILSVSRWTIGIHWWSIPLQVASMLLIAEASYCFIEQPARNKKLPITRGKLILMGAATLALSSFATRQIGNTSNQLLLGMPRNREAIYSEHSDWNQEQCMNSRWLNLLPSEITLEQCWVRGKRVTDSSELRLKRVFTYGDSYNQQLVPAYSQISKKNPEILFHAYASSGCTASARLSFKEEKHIGHCAKLFQSYINWFNANSRRGDLLLIALSPDYFFTAPEPKYHFLANQNSINASKALKIYISELLQVIEQQRARGVRVIVTSGIPILKYNPDLCSQWYAEINNDCGDGEIHAATETGEVERINAAIFSEIKDAAAWVDLFTTFSHSKRPIDTYRKYFGQYHLSREGAFSTVKKLRRQIYNKDQDNTPL